MHLLIEKRPFLFSSVVFSVFLILFFFPVFFQNKVLAPLDILDYLMEPWASNGPKAVQIATERAEGKSGIHVHNAFVYDAISQYIPYDWSIYGSLKESGTIGWNPYTHNGTAIRENHMLCPSSTRHLFYRVAAWWDARHPGQNHFWPAWNAGRIFHVFLAGLGILVLLSRFRKRVSLPAIVCGSVTAAFAYALQAQSTLWFYTDVILSGCAWSPWMLWALLQWKDAIQENRGLSRKIVFFGLSVLFTGLGFRCGFLHTTLFNLALYFVFVAVESIAVLRAPLPRHLRSHFGGDALILLGGLLIALPFFLDVVPPTLTGGHRLHAFSVLDGIRAIPTGITAIFPYVLGSPHGMDAAKLFGTGLHCILFAGGTAFLLSIHALFRKEAPHLPKVLFLLFFLIPFTPLRTWFYFRCEVLSGLGIAWLAAWSIFRFGNGDVQAETYWNRVWKGFLYVILAWFLASILLVVFHPQLLAKLSDFTLKSIPPDKINRLPWMLERSEVFLKESMIWHPHTFASIIALGCGIGCCKALSKPCRNHPSNWLFAGLTLATTFEMALFFWHWNVAYEKPTALDAPYNHQAWISELKEHLSDGGSLAILGRSRFDYFQFNTPSAFGIRQATGYESVQPEYIHPLNPAAFDPEDYAQAGISHILLHPDDDFTNSTEWISVADTPNYRLYRNPAFSSPCVAILQDGTRHSIPYGTIQESRDSLTMMVPPHCESIEILRSSPPTTEYPRTNQGGIILRVQNESDGTVPARIRFYRTPESP